MPIDWTKGMQQTFEYYEVDPVTWKDKQKLSWFTSSEITRDLSLDTLGSARFDSTKEYGEIYVRTYLKAVQNRITYKECLGTSIIQTPDDGFDGKMHSFSYDAYTPLLELKDDYPPIGYYIPKGSNIMDIASRICREKLRIPTIPAVSDVTLVTDFISEDSESWLNFISDLIANANFELGLDQLSRIIFLPKQDPSALQPVWTFHDDNSSILLPDIKTHRDLYGVPNVVEVLYTTSNEVPIYKRVENNDENSPISIPSRGRVVCHRETSPSLNGNATEEEVEKYAINLLKTLSTLEYEVTYTHGYCPVMIGDGVMLNYERAGIQNTKAKVTRQRITCEPGCQVEETAVFTKSLWSGS